MIDNMSQQNSPFHGSEASVLIPVWKTGERDEGKLVFLFFFYWLSFCIRTERPNTKKQERRREENVKQTLANECSEGRQAGRQTVRQKEKRDDMGKTKRPNAVGWKKR